MTELVRLVVLVLKKCEVIKVKLNTCVIWATLVVLSTLIEAAGRMTQLLLIVWRSSSVAWRVDSILLPACDWSSESLGLSFGPGLMLEPHSFKLPD